MKEMKIKKSVILIAALALGLSLQAQHPGEKTFKTICGACHSIGKGKVVGPDLKGVSTRYPEKWISSFIKSSQTMVKNGDAKAVKTFNDNNKVVMPDQNLTDVQIKQVIEYIKSMSKPATSTVTTSGNAQGSKTNTASTASKNNAPPPADPTIRSKKVNGDINARDINSANWASASAVQVPLSPQNVVAPMLKKESVASVQVKCINNGNAIAFQLVWADSTMDNTVDVTKFCDQIAVQLPVSSENPPSYMMGHAGGKVHIVHWKAVWQEDVENGFRDVQKAYPNMWVDVYPGHEAALNPEKKIYAKDLSAEKILESGKTNAMPGTYSGNPVSSIKRKEPVEEAWAEGYGKYTTHKTQNVSGWAEWKNNKWTVCMVMPMNPGDGDKASIGEKTSIAFAVWNGNYQNIGGRKHYAPWTELIIEK